MPYLKNIKAPARVTYGTCARCGRHSPMCALVVWQGERRPIMACATCRLNNIEHWCIAPGWEDGMPREHDTSLSTVKFREWAAQNAPLDLDDEPDEDCCVRGHPWTPENTRVKADGRRVCRACHRDRERGRIRTRAMEERR